MAKSKRIIITICAVLITIVIGTVSANAFQITTSVIKYSNAFVPINTLSMSYQIDNTNSFSGKTGYVDISPPTMSNIDLTENYIEPFSYTVTPSFPSTSVLYGRDDEFAVDLSILQSTTDSTTKRNVTSWGFHNVNTDTYGYDHSLQNGHINILKANLIGNDFIYKREYFDYTDNIVITTGSTAEDNMRVENSNVFTITFIVPTEQADGTIALLPISISDAVYYSSNINQTISSFPLFMRESDLDNTIRNASNVTTAQKEYMLNSEYFFVEQFIRTINIPEVNNQYQGTIIQTFGYNSANATNTPFRSMINELPTGHPQVSEFNILETLVGSVDNALSIPIIGELTLGWIVWICVAIGILFAILKYFAGG